MAQTLLHDGKLGTLQDHHAQTMILSFHKIPEMTLIHLILIKISKVCYHML